MRTTSLLLALLLSAGSTAAAQQARPSPLAVDTNAEVGLAIDADGNYPRAAIFDAVISAGLGRHFEAIVRPFVQRLTTGEWNRQIWVAALRYQRPGAVGIARRWRADPVAGRARPT